MSNASNNSIVKSMIGETFLSLANALETGQFGKKIVVGITNRGSCQGSCKMDGRTGKAQT